jgi:DNA gyrase subunit B
MAKTNDASESSYDASGIQVLKGLEAVRKRPGMYIGSTSHRACTTWCTRWSTTPSTKRSPATATRSTSRSTPTTRSPWPTTAAASRWTSTRSRSSRGVELALTVLHAGGKFDKNTYKVSGGLHGVGVSVVNALSEYLKVWVKRDGKEHYMDFCRGDTTTKLKVLGTVEQGHRHHGLLQAGRADLHRARVRLRTLSTRLRELSFLNKGVTITLKDVREGKEREETFHARAASRSSSGSSTPSRSRCTPRSSTSRARRTTSGSSSRCSTTTATTRTSSPS